MTQISDKIAVTGQVVEHSTRPRLARVGASLLGVSMTKAKRKFTIRNPEAFAAKQRKASLAAAAKRMQTAPIFWERVTKSEGCWTWGGPQSDRGYGRTSLGGRIWAAHR